jgi:hypothetical protein
LAQGLIFLSLESESAFFLSPLAFCQDSLTTMKFASVLLLALFNASVTAQLKHRKLLEASEHRIPGQYIVVLEHNAVDVEEKMANMTAEVESRCALRKDTGHSGSLLFSFRSALEGMTFSCVDPTTLKKWLDDKDVAFIEEVRKTRGTSFFCASHFPFILTQTLPRLFISQDKIVRADKVQLSAPWGLDRLDTKQLNLDQRYTYSFDGSGVDVYILDSGIRASHRDFNGRVQCGYDAWGNDACEDGYGHGMSSHLECKVQHCSSTW